MQLLIDHINNVFPDSSTKLPHSIKAYFSFRDELRVCNGDLKREQQNHCSRKFETSGNQHFA